MEAEDGKQELRVGSLVPVLVEHMVNDTLVVTLSCGERSYSGVLLDCTKSSGLFCVPSAAIPKNEDPPVNGSCDSILGDANSSHSFSETPSQDTVLPVASNGDQVPPLLPPPGTASSYPPYFEGAPFPPPLLLRHSYNQWVPQPPPRAIKRTKRRMSRNRHPGRLIMSTIRLRPRQVLCEKCKNTLNTDKPDKDKQNPKSVKKPQSEDRDQPKKDSDAQERKTVKDRREDQGSSKDLVHPSKDLIHRSPVIKISYSTPQGKGEVVKIPSRVHGSVEPFCPNQTQENVNGDHEMSNDLDRCETPRRVTDRSTNSQVASIPKLKLTKPLHSNVDIPPPPKIRLKPQRISDGQNVSVYKSELIDQMNVLQGSRESTTSSSAFYLHNTTETSFQDISLGSSGEDEDFKGYSRSKEGHNLNLIMNYRKRKADSSSASLCSNDSLDDSKSSCLELNRMDFCDLMPGDDLSVSSSKDVPKTVPPLTVRLHSKSVTNCITVDGKTISVGDIVWGKVHGFPWWPARILSINVNHKENGELSWQEATVSWFGSPTTSSLSVSKLSSFSEFFKLRFNRKKKGVYRKAIAEAAKATNHITPEIRELLMQCET